MTHTAYVYIAAAYLAIMLLSILQRVIRSQRVYTYYFDSAKGDTFSLRKVSVAKFSETFKFKFLGLMKRYKKFRPCQRPVFKKEMFLLCPYE